MVRGWQGPESKIRPFSTQLTPRPLEATWPIARCLPGCSLTQGLSAGQPSLPLLGLRARCQPRRPPVLSLPTVRRAGSWQEGRDCPQGLWAARRLGPPYSLSLGGQLRWPILSSVQLGFVARMHFLPRGEGAWPEERESGPPACPAPTVADRGLQGPLSELPGCP